MGVGIQILNELREILTRGPFEYAAYGARARPIRGDERAAKGMRRHPETTLYPGLLTRGRFAQVIADGNWTPMLRHQVPGGAGLRRAAQTPELMMNKIIVILEPVDERHTFIGDALLYTAEHGVGRAKQRFRVGGAANDARARH